MSPRASRPRARAGRVPDERARAGREPDERAPAGRVPIERASRAERPRRPRVPVRRILETLAAKYPRPKTALHWETPFQLLVATILSAQSTDAQVNKVTPRLFARYPDAHAMSRMSQAELEDSIRHLGLYRAKAKNILATCRILVDRYGGEVPADREALQSLPGVGRKTANVVLANAFGVPAIAVDTHVFRVANRLGLAEGKTPEEVEEQLMRRIPRSAWADAHHWLIYHGRDTCHARRPACEACELRPCCRAVREGRFDVGSARGRKPAE